MLRVYGCCTIFLDPPNGGLESQVQMSHKIVKPLARFVTQKLNTDNPLTY